MWIVDDDGDMFNTDHFDVITFKENEIKMSFAIPNDVVPYITYKLSKDLTDEERLTRYNDLVEKLTGERIDE